MKKLLSWSKRKNDNVGVRMERNSWAPSVFKVEQVEHDGFSYGLDAQRKESEVSGMSSRILSVIGWIVKSESVSHSVCIQLFATPRTVACQAPLFMDSDKNTGVGSHSILWGIFPTRESNPDILHCRQIFYHPSHQGSPIPLCVCVCVCVCVYIYIYGCIYNWITLLYIWN